MIVFPTPSSKVTEPSTPDPWSCKRDPQPWLKGSTNQGTLILSDTNVFGHQGCWAVSGMLDVYVRVCVCGVFKRSPGKQKSRLDF